MTIIIGIILLSVMGDTGDRKSGAGPSGVKKFEENCEQYVELARGVTVLDYHAHGPRDPRAPFNVNREVCFSIFL